MCARFVEALLRGSEWLEVKWQFVPVIHQWTSSINGHQLNQRKLKKYVNMFYYDILVVIVWCSYR